ncbi:MAG: hypothetical protein PVI23_16465, partial [Maricaulaceae bacterium]
AAGDALLIVRLWSEWSVVERLQASASNADFTERARELIAEENAADPDAAAALACAAVALFDKDVDPSEFVVDLVRKRDQHRVDQTLFVFALNVAVLRTCQRGQGEVHAADVAPERLTEIAVARAEAVKSMRAHLQGHVTTAWMREFSDQIISSSEAFAGRCKAYARDILSVATPPESNAAAVVRMQECAARAQFLVDAERASGLLRFDVSRQAALNDVRDWLDRSGVDAIEKMLARLARTSLADAERWLDGLAELVQIVEDDRAARAWERRGRRIIGRPSFEESVLAPLEPLLIDDPRVLLRRGQISRDLVETAWSRVVGDQLADSLASAREKFQAQRDDDPASAARVVNRFREELCLELGFLVDEGAGAFGGRGQSQVSDQMQLTDAAAILGAVGEIDAALAEWPARVRHVEHDHVLTIRALHEQLSATWPEIGPALLLVVMDRLERPWHVLRALERIARTRRDTVIEATEFSSIGEVLIDIAEEAASAFAPGEPGRFQERPAIAALEVFAGIASGMTEEFDIRKNGAWGRRLYALKTRAARHLEAICNAAVEAVEEITPRHALANGQWAAAPEEHLDPDDVETAAEYAAFLRESKVLDQRAAFAGARAKALSAVEGRLESQIDALLRDAHANDERQGALAQLEALAIVVAAFEGEDAGQIVRRRAAAA